MISLLTIADWRKYINLREQLTGYHFVITEEEFKRKYREMEGEIYVLKENNKMVGTIRMIIIPKFHNNVAWIDDFVIDKDYRNKGYGKRLLRYIMNKAKNLDCYKVIASTRHESGHFYSSFGMEQTGKAFTSML
jgi:N-acetylglutamate synthase-like GNAT family acetyltransferase